MKPRGREQLLISYLPIPATRPWVSSPGLHPPEVGLCRFSPQKLDFAIFSTFSQRLSARGSSSSARRAVKPRGRVSLLTSYLSIPTTRPWVSSPELHPVEVKVGLCHFYAVFKTPLGPWLRGGWEEGRQTRGPRITFDGLPSRTKHLAVRLTPWAPPLRGWTLSFFAPIRGLL